MQKSLSIQDFNYDLPDDSVAKYPLAERDNSKLLVWEDKKISDHQFSDLPELLPPGSMLVFNNTRVIRARLLFTKSTGAKIEVFCLEPTDPADYVLSFAQTTSCRWKCIIGNLKRWKGEELRLEIGDMRDERGRETRRKEKGDKEKGEGRRESWKLSVGAALCGRPIRISGKLRVESEELRVESGGGRVSLCAELMGELEGGFEVEFSWDNPQFTFSEILEAAGNIPIPPYLHRESEEIDSVVYQTVYSKIKGSVAAPTAGLHFTDRVFRALEEKQISCQELTLHVGAGTFKPVKSETIGEHQMHVEHFSVSKAMIDRLISHPGKVIAVGTTSVRTLESLYWIGRKILKNTGIQLDLLPVSQWEPYGDTNGKIEAKEALRAISDWMSANKLATLETSTQIMILPGYEFRIIAGLVTNFHQPQSTLLLLISAILGEEWKKIYAHALLNGYRFLSYGDSNLYLIC